MGPTKFDLLNERGSTRALPLAGNTTKYYEIELISIHTLPFVEQIVHHPVSWREDCLSLTSVQNKKEDSARKPGVFQMKPSGFFRKRPRFCASRYARQAADERANAADERAKAADKRANAADERVARLAEEVGSGLGSRIPFFRLGVRITSGGPFSVVPRIKTASRTADRPQPGEIEACS